MQQHAPHTPEPAPGLSGGQVEDINIPLVAVSVGFFAFLLAATILSLQAWFTNADRAEIAAKIDPQEDPQTYDALAKGHMVTPLGLILQEQRAQLEVPPVERRTLPVATTPATTSTATASQPAKKLWIPIQTAMELVSRDYQPGGTQP